MPDIILLMAGPTASGKSKIALKLASLLGGMIINADSMQVYRDLSGLTARPDAADEACVPHRMYGFMDAAEACSAALWHTALEAALEEAGRLSLMPIIVGGTGLYFRVALEGLSHIPAIPDELREDIRGDLTAEGAAALHAVLENEDPEMAVRLAPGDGQRIARALEVIRATGRSLASWQKHKGKAILKQADSEGRVVKIILEVPRDELYARIDARFDQMIESNVIKEVQSLLDRKLDPGLPVMRALGVPHLGAFIRGEIDLPQAVQKAKTESRRLAKRQITWFNNQFPDWQRIKSGEADAAGKIFKIVQAT